MVLKRIFAFLCHFEVSFTGQIISINRCPRIYTSRYNHFRTSLRTKIKIMIVMKHYDQLEQPFADHNSTLIINNTIREYGRGTIGDGMSPLSSAAHNSAMSWSQYFRVMFFLREIRPVIKMT